MAANIFGDRFLSTREPAWHAIGQQCAGDMTAREALEASGLDYEVKTIPLPVPLTTETGEIKFLDSRTVALVRDPVIDDPEHRVLGTASTSYTVVQNSEIVGMIDPLTDEWPVETIGALGQGERIFVVLSCEKYEVLGEEIREFLTISDGKNGVNGLNVMLTPVCTVCQNTLLAAESESSFSLSLRHTKDIKEDFQWNLNLVTELKRFKSLTRENFSAMGETPADVNEVAKILNAAFPLPTKPRKVRMVEESRKELGLDATASEWEITRDIRESFERERERAKELRSAGVTLYTAYGDARPNIANTVWGAYQAVTELASWREGASEERTARSVMFGEGRDEARRAYKAAMEVVNA